MNIKFMTCLLATVTLAVGVSLSTASIIAYQDGETHAHNGWNIGVVVDGSANGAGTPVVPYVGGVGGHGNVGQITETTTTGPDIDNIYNSLLNDGLGLGGNNGLVGNYLNLGGGGQTVLSMTAEFYAYQTVGTEGTDFRLYMLAGGHAWYYDAGPLNPGWNVFNVNMLHIGNIGVPGGWYSEDGWGATQFYADLATVTQLGFELQYLVNQPNQEFGFDYIALYDTYFIPEPRTYLVLVVALASLAFVFREQVRQTLGTVLSSIRV